MRLNPNWTYYVCQGLWQTIWPLFCVNVKFASKPTMTGLSLVITAMQAETIMRLCDSVINKTELVDANSIKLRARETSQKFKTLNTLHSNIHANISHSRPLSKENVNNLDIKQYMSFYRRVYWHTNHTETTSAGVWTRENKPKMARLLEVSRQWWRASTYLWGRLVS